MSALTNFGALSQHPVVVMPHRRPASPLGGDHFGWEGQNQIAADVHEKMLGLSRARRPIAFVTTGLLTRTEEERSAPFPYAARHEVEGARAEQTGTRPYVAAIWQLLGADRLPAARRFLDAIPLHISNDPAIVRLRAVLAPPLVRRVQRQDVDRGPEYAWLRAEGQQYRGQWVALEGGRLLAAAHSLRDLKDQLRRLPMNRPRLIHRIE